MEDICVILLIIELIILLHILYIVNYQKIKECFISENFKFIPGCDDPKLLQLQEKLKPMFADNIIYDGVLANINKKEILHDLTLCKGDKSYTINKEDIYICLTDEKGQYYNDNMLIYVLLHELSHYSCKTEIGHTPLFHKIFQEYLKKATELKIYDPNIPIIRDYCLYNDNK